MSVVVSNCKPPAPTRPPPLSTSKRMPTTRDRHAAARDAHRERLRQQRVRRRVLAVARHVEQLLHRGQRREELAAVADDGDRAVAADLDDAEAAIGIGDAGRRARDRIAVVVARPLDVAVIVRAGICQ